MTTGAEVLAPDKPRLLKQLVGSYIDLDGGLDPDHHILRGFVKAAATVLTGSSLCGGQFLAEVDFAFRGLLGATEELAAFEADPNGFLDGLGMSRNPASVTSTGEILNRNLDGWADRLSALQPMAKVVGL